MRFADWRIQAGSLKSEPILWDECRDVFGIPDLEHRVLMGGLPESLLSSRKDQGFYSEWLDSFFARDIAHNIYLITPFHGGGKREITARPKVYAFDTGFVTFVKGWNEIRAEDKGLLWEHLVLDMIRSYLPGQKIYYWRDKSNREVDFVLPKSDGRVDIIECKINPDYLSTIPIKSFQEIYPKGLNICYSPYIQDTYSSRKNNLRVDFIGTLKDYAPAD